MTVELFPVPGRRWKRTEIFHEDPAELECLVKEKVRQLNNRGISSYYIIIEKFSKKITNIYFAER